MSARGCYIALEGADGSGKSTQARLLASRRGALLTREPGGTSLGTSLRNLLLHSEPGDTPTPWAEAMLFAADRAQHIGTVVAPELAAGRDVVTDRSYGSTLAYQGYGRGLPLSELRSLVAVASRQPPTEPTRPSAVTATDVASSDVIGPDVLGPDADGPAALGPDVVRPEVSGPDVLLPDVVVLLDVPLMLSAQRRQGEPDRIESESDSFVRRVADGFLALCAAEPDRWVRVDGTGDVETVAERVDAAVADMLSAQH